MTIEELGNLGEFVAEVDGFLEQTPLSTYQDDIRHYDDPARTDHPTRPGQAAGVPHEQA